jgi:FixJ family two-component response regulator
LHQRAIWHARRSAYQAPPSSQSIGCSEGRILKTIVVVDDDYGMRQALARVLGAAGFHAVTFPSAEELLDSGEAVDAACLVLDIQLPGLSGLDLRRRIVGAGGAAPVIFITAHDRPGLEAEATSLGAAAFLTKPFPGLRLVQAVGAALESR